MSVRLRRRPHPGPYLIFGLFDLRVCEAVAYQLALLSVESALNPPKPPIFAVQQPIAAAPDPPTICTQLTAADADDGSGANSPPHPSNRATGRKVRHPESDAPCRLDQQDPE